MEKELVPAESVKQKDEKRSTERYRNRLTEPRRNRSMLTCHHRSIDIQNSAEEPLTFLETENSSGKTRTNMESTEMIRDTKLVPEIYTKDEINEMFYGVCGEQEKNKEAFQMNLDGVYYPLNDSISWLTTCMEEMKQDIARIQHATDVAQSSSIDRDQHTSVNVCQRTSIDNQMPTSVDDNPPHLHMMKHNNKSTDIHKRTSVDDATNQGRLVPKMTSDMSDTHYHGEEISVDTYSTLRRHQFNPESLEERLQRMENTTAKIKEKRRRGDEAM
ncbi:hypothetical protein F2Q70_00025801 [Brassica cretica]|uniref:Uncharacterized protein n=1 Tax=Brassica cretica TaxID=69181 RepID=A0A8S9LFA1_BRACR|nr:hypothetical protein F2Q70_00025801 [Brassica cretica]